MNFYQYIRRGILLSLLSSAVFSVSAQTAGTERKLGLRTVVLDAGHGGRDPGCVSADRQTYERTLTLDIVKRLGALISRDFPDVKVVYTRKDNTYITLNDRADIANRADADLFVSVHINASPGTAPNGWSVHILGESKNKNRDLFASHMDVCKRENSVILLEDDYSAKYQGFDPRDPESFIFFSLMQNVHREQSFRFAGEVDRALKGGPLRRSNGIWQDPFYVLWKTTMPAVLVELGFISNLEDLKTLREEGARERLAECLLQAFASFKRDYDGSVRLGGDPASAAAAGTPGSSAATPAKAPVSAKSGENAATRASAPDAGTSSTSSAAANTSGSSAASPAKAPVSAKSGENAPTRASAPAAGASSTSSAAATPAKARYGYQIFALGRKLADGDAAFKGHKAEAIASGRVYKYIVRVADTPALARTKGAALRKDFPSAFLVEVGDDGSVSPVR